MNRIAIRHRLVDKHMSLIELSRRTGLTYDRLLRVVNGYRCPKKEEIVLIAEILGTTPDQIT